MIEQTGNAITFFAFYVASQVGKTGLTVTIDVYNPAGSLVVTAGSASEVGGGLYKYVLASGSVTAEGEYPAIFKTADTTVDAKHIPALWTIGRAGIEDLDATISSRLATAGYTAPDNASLTTLIGRLTAGRATLLDNLALLDAAITTRLADADYADPDNAGVATLLDRLTALRAGYLDRLNGTVTVNILAPLDPTTYALTLKSGDSYTDALDRAITFEDGGQWPDITAAVVTFAVGNTAKEDGVLTVTASVIVGTPQQVEVELTAAQTRELSLSQGTYWYDLRATLGADVVTLSTGTIRVLKEVNE